MVGFTDWNLHVCWQRASRCKQVITDPSPKETLVLSLPTINLFLSSSPPPVIQQMTVRLIQNKHIWYIQKSSLSWHTRLCALQETEELFHTQSQIYSRTSETWFLSKVQLLNIFTWIQDKDPSPHISMRKIPSSNNCIQGSFIKYTVWH